MRPRDPDRGRPGDARARRPRRRVEQGLPVPEGRRRSGTSTTTPTASGCRWSATATSGARSRGTRRSPAARSCCGRSSTEHGIGAVTAYIGNPTVHNYSLSRYTGAVAGIPRHAGRSGRPAPSTSGPRTSPAPSCSATRGRIPIPDVPRTDLLRGHGRQPARVARLAAVVPRPHRRDRRASASAAAARSWSTRAAPARPSGPTSGSRSCPGTDAAFLLAVVHVLDDEGLIRLGTLDGPGARHRRGAAPRRATSPPRRSPTRAA